MFSYQLSYNYNFDSFTTIERPPAGPEFVEAALQRRQRCLCGSPNCVGWLGKDPAESSKATVDDNIAPEFRAPVLEPVVESEEQVEADAPPHKKILLKIGNTASSSSTRSRGTKRQAAVEEDVVANKRVTAPGSSKGKAKANASKSMTAEVDESEAAPGFDATAGLTLVGELPEQYMTAEMQGDVDLPVAGHLAGLLHSAGSEYVEGQYTEEGAYAPAEGYEDATGYADSIAYSEAHPEQYLAEEDGTVETSQPKKSSRGKGVRVIEKHRRKTKYGLIWKSDAELELERR